MISKLEGNIVFKGDRFVILDVSGVGYKVNVPLDILRKLSNDSPASFWTYLAVREDALDLYGFFDQAELELFEMLIGISGVGPRSALGVMNVADVDTLKTAIASGDVAYLTKVSGIGRKSAEKIILELRDKMGIFEGGAEGTGLREESDAVDALKSLGYSPREAREALKQVPQDVKGASNRIKEALKLLGK